MSGYRPEYTKEEQKEIISYIIDNQGVHQLRGIKFWKDMEECGKFNRTWQSLKEHFRKKIFPDLHLYKLSEEDYTLLKEAYSATANAPKEEKTATASKSDEYLLTFTDSEEEDKKKEKKKERKSREYTKEEQKQILRYIVDNHGQYQLHGIKFWRDMSDTDDFDRTWQSLKEHFKKNIYRNIDTFNLGIKEITSIQEGYEATRRTVTKKKKKQRTDESEDD